MTMFRPAFIPGIAFEHGGGLTPCQIANVLDGLSLTPIAAYSTRKLLSTYAGFSLRVQRSSDANQQDIGFGTDCSLDNTALLSFCSGTNCKVIKWYDQTGNTNDLVTGSLGPDIVTGGALTATMNGHTATSGSGTGSETLQVNSDLVSTTAGSVFVVGNATSGGTTSATASWWHLPALLGASSSDNNGLALNFGFGQTGPNWGPPSFIPTRYVGDWLGSHTDMNTPVTYSFGTNQIFAFRWSTSDPTPTKGYIGGGIPSTDANATANAAGLAFYLYIGGNLGATSNFTGQIAETIVFAAELSLTDSNTLGTNQALYWGLTWSNIVL